MNIGKRRRNILIFHSIIFALLLGLGYNLTRDEGALCSDGQFYDKAYKVCKYCHPSCFGCIKNANTCISCASDTYLSQGRCHIICPNQLYPNSFTRRCEKCPEGYVYLKDLDKCLESCPSDYKIANTTLECVKKPIEELVTLIDSSRTQDLT